MTIEIHGMSLSGPCRIVYMTCEALGLEYKEISCDLFKGEHKTEEFLKVKACQLFPHFLSHIFISFYLFSRFLYVQ